MGFCINDLKNVRWENKEYVRCEWGGFDIGLELDRILFHDDKAKLDRELESVYCLFYKRFFNCHFCNRNPSDYSFEAAEGKDFVIRTYSPDSRDPGSNSLVFSYNQDNGFWPSVCSWCLCAVSGGFSDFQACDDAQEVLLWSSVKEKPDDGLPHLALADYLEEYRYNDSRAMALAKFHRSFGRVRSQ